MHDPRNLELPETKKRAQALGLDFFYTGKKCKNGHLDKRSAQTGNCFSCLLNDGKAGRLANERNGKKIRSDENQKRAEAAYKLGLSTYLSTGSCPHGHFERYVTSNNCVECNRVEMSKRSEKVRWKRIEKEYGITKAEFQNMVSSQNNKCLICNSCFEVESKIHIDHCHETGFVRGLLCPKCNQGIGLLGDSVEILESAIMYLKGCK
jgi:hypothetical protein